MILVTSKRLEESRGFAYFHIDLIRTDIGEVIYTKTYRVPADKLNQGAFEKNQLLTGFQRDFAAEVDQLLNSGPRRSAEVNFEVMP